MAGTEGQAMTRNQALAEARRRWGPLGHLMQTSREGGGTWKHVGVLETFPVARFVARGCGGRWESAFRDADIAEARRIEQRQERSQGNVARRRWRGRRGR